MVLYRILTLVAAFLLAFTPVARAEGLSPLPELSAQFDLNGYAANTDTITKEFPDIPNVAFELSLPKTWIERSALGQSYGELIRYEGPAVGDVRPYFSFKRIALKRENTAAHELVSYLLKQAYVLRSIHEIDDRNVEALYVLVNEAGDDFAVRAKIRIVGPDMLMAEYGVPIRGFDRMRDEQTFAVRSFKYLKDSKDTIEKRVERTYFRALRFYYPASWVFDKEESSAENRVRLTLVNKGDNGEEVGKIKITLLSTASLKDDEGKKVFNVDVSGELKDIRKRYEDAKYVFGPTIENRKPDLNLPTSFATLNAYQMQVKTGQYDTDALASAHNEVWLTVFRTSGPLDRTYVVEMLTPSRSENLYMWSVNTRTYELILKSIQ
ncbi:MAG: hypothetical protein KGQ41_07235 [Alphaproteobacteria bacterium]|nr:hypothetical protein [Alphaproteobacteria bacterium]